MKTGQNLMNQSMRVNRILHAVSVETNADKLRAALVAMTESGGDVPIVREAINNRLKELS